MRRLKAKLIDDAIALLDATIELPEGEVTRARDYWKKLSPLLADICRISGEDKRLAPLVKLRSTIESAAAKLLKSISASTGPLGKEWKLFAKNDLEELKDHLVAAKEIIIKNQHHLSRLAARASLKEKAGVDPESLINELHNAGAISDRTWLLLVTRGISPSDLSDPRVSRSIERIAQLFLEFEEVRG
ncbi:MAG: hypothetical protein ACK4GQ_05360 [Candidatus Hadarchaeales archaeon]